MAATEYFGETAVQPRYHVPVNTSRNHTITHFPSSETQGRSVGPGEKARQKFQAQAEKPLGTDSHQTISKRSSECWLLIGHKKCFVLFCPIGEQHLLSSFREFVHDSFYLRHICPIRSPSFPNQKRRNYR